MIERRVVAVRGTVQGVGFRPFIRNLAAGLDLRGRVWNDSDGVTVDVEGAGDTLDRFLALMRTSQPPLAVIESVSFATAPPADHADFVVVPSDPSRPPTAPVAADAATCDDCLAELFDSSNRRYRHPFISCSHCGPRFTIVTAIPYDRPRTTMAGFPMCRACHDEYSDPANRRFHAQPIACHECGPTLAFDAADGREATGRGLAALTLAAAALARGAIVAIKGLGGYHLCCDARNDAAVERLRARKQRAARPLAIMVRDLDAARRVAHVRPQEEALLTAAARPIVLLTARAASGLARAVAPSLPTLGVMLAYTPLHHLLLADHGGPLVMTSGNRSEEPIAYEDADARARLRDVADGFLSHDRPIATRCDDSVMRVVAGAPTFVRRSRGHAPAPIRLARQLPVSVLALGGHQKNAFCLGRGDQAFMSQHIGDLDHPGARQALREGVARFQRLHGIAPQVVAHDLHDEYASSQLAHAMGLPTVAVQHHHAHVAACVAEHGAEEPVLGVAFDGSGAGTDGAVWGGEFLLVEGSACERLAHIGYVPLPGGEAAVREPWRMAAAHLAHAYGGEVDALSLPLLERRPREVAVLRQMMAQGFRAPPTSSAGRLFDAVAALLGVREVAAYEAQAATELEALADRATRRSYTAELREAGGALVADPGAMVRGVVDDLRHGRTPAEIAGAFHNAMRDLVSAVVARLAARTGVRHVALSGGVFQNALLLERTASALAALDCQVFIHRRVPCNDGGLALGQATVAAHRFATAGG